MKGHCYVREFVVNVVAKARRVYNCQCNAHAVFLEFYKTH